MMKWLVIYAAVSTLALAALVARGAAANPLSETDQQTMQVAAQLYSSGQYNDAARLYQQVVDQGAATAALYYNLGSAYAQMGDTGWAILNYRRAQHLTPRDPAIRANLESIVRQANLQPDTLAGSPLERLADAAQSLFTSNELALLALAGWFGIPLFWMLRTAASALLLRRLALAALLLSAGLLTLGGFTLAIILYREQVAPAAVVVAPVTLAGTTLPVGSEVSVIAQRGDQLRVNPPGRDTNGWISIESVVII